MVECEVYMAKKIRTLSFFSGCGGLDLGFHNAGFEILYSSDIERQFCETIESNKGLFFSKKLNIECGDIREIDPNKLPDDIDFIIGGPPCQTFSASGRRAGGAAGQQDKRGTLFQAYGKIISAKKPLGFLFENVRGILGSNKGKDWEDIKGYFLDLGYRLDYRVLDACDYGIAQHRERLILVGHKMDIDYKFPKPTFGPDSKNCEPHITAKEALKYVKHDENLSDLECKGGKYSHLLQEVPYGGNYLFFTEKRGYPDPVFAYRSRFSDFLYKADPNAPTKTIIASPGKYTGPLHWKNRYFSIAEYKRLQGFPDDFIVTGNRSVRIKQIGNSVSPKIAEMLAISVKKQLFEMKPHRNIDFIDSNFLLSFDKRKGKKAQATRKKHLSIEKMRDPKSRKFNATAYKAEIFPHSFLKSINNVELKIESDKKLKLIVRSDNSKKLFSKMTLLIGKSMQSTPLLPDFEYQVEVILYGINDHSIQTMWNAIDDWVIRSSNYHSLFEIYGHFTEPHPDFYINDFQCYSNHPICKFASFASNFSNCSKVVNREHLTKLFSSEFGIGDFIQLVEYLRNFRFDIRCKEINIAMDDNSYIIAYPFTLPNRKQMNFMIKTA